MLVDAEVDEKRRVLGVSVRQCLEKSIRVDGRFDVEFDGAGEHDLRQRPRVDLVDGTCDPVPMRRGVGNQRDVLGVGGFGCFPHDRRTAVRDGLGNQQRGVVGRGEPDRPRDGADAPGTQRLGGLGGIGESR